MPTPESPTPQPSASDPAVDWAERGIGTDWQYRFFSWLIRHRGKNRAYFIASIVTFWYVLFYPSIRRRSSFYLKRRFKERTGVFARFVDTYRHARTYAITLVDMTALKVLGPQSLVAVSPDHDRLVEIASGAKGFVLIHAHVGCWQIGMSTLGEFQKQIAIVQVPESRTAMKFDSKRITTIDPHHGLEGVIQMTQVLLDGQILVMMGDRTFGAEPNTVKVRFLGDDAAFPTTPYRLASATGVPVVVMAAPKIDSKSYQLRLIKVIEVPPGLGRKAQPYAPYAQQFADCLEAFVQEYPWQFYNFYDVWEKDQ